MIRARNLDSLLLVLEIFAAVSAEGIGFIGTFS